MKFDSSSLPKLPTPEQMTELNDLLVSATELYQIYSSLEWHPRIITSQKSLELFTSCREQLHQDMTLLDEQLEMLLNLTRSTTDTGLGKVGEDTATFAHSSGTEGRDPFHFIPDVQRTDVGKSVFEIVRKVFENEDRFNGQLNNCLLSAQMRKHLKLELQLKMIILAADQRYRFLEDRYGYAKTKNSLFQGLRRQTTRFLSALNGEKRNDIDA